MVSENDGLKMKVNDLSSVVSILKGKGLVNDDQAEVLIQGSKRYIKQVRNDDKRPVSYRTELMLFALLLNSFKKR